MPLYEKPDRRVYNPDYNLVNQIQTHYSRILDNVGLNVADPIAANVGFFNNSGKVFAEPMKLGRTMIFFTRPNLNFRSKHNLDRSRIFSYYKNNPLSLTLMRTLMYPDIAKLMCYNYYYDERQENPNRIEVLGNCDDTIIGGEDIESLENNIHSLPLAKTNFIPLLSNTCISTGASKDIVLDTVDTEPNFQGDKHRYANGIDESLSVGELNCTFEDLYYSPILILFFLWIMYMHYVSKGICDPYYEYMIYRIIDYTCSIYVFMLGTDNQTIIRWVKYGGAFPINIPFNAIQHSKEANSNDALRNLEIPFVYNYMCPMDPLVLTEFNILSGPSIRHRLAKCYGDVSGEKTNRLIQGHFLRLSSGGYGGDAIELLTKYPPIYKPSIDNTSPNSLPVRLFEPMDSEVKFVTGYEGRQIGDERNIDDALLKNRVNGSIENNFYGVPYIAEGNRLMFV
jgi:hypothetical protein